LAQIINVSHATHFANSIQGEASSEDHQGSPGKGCQRRYSLVPVIECDGQRGAIHHAPSIRQVLENKDGKAKGEAAGLDERGCPYTQDAGT
jgi:hypothetical protein